ncbi:MAG: DUF2334 domain-containing protein [Thermoleophilia bacterium]|nr:DUF2334 domain-containing protein [Thermoleophilia bacterium]
MRRLVLVSLHDVAPGSLDEVAAWRAEVAARTGGPASLLVVPRFHGREPWRPGPGLTWLRERAAAGDEVVLHGYAHLGAPGRGERELAGRPDRDVLARVREGREELARAGLAVGGFIAPCYAHPPAADRACREAGMRWWATRSALRSPRARRVLPSVGLGASTPLRRAASPAAARALARALAPVPAVRLDLHPADLRDPRLRHAGLVLLEILLAEQGRVPATHAGLIAA